MKVFFVGAGPGDPELLTLKAARILSECRICIYAGSLVSPGVMELVPKTAEQYNSAGMNLKQIVEVYSNAKRRDIDVVRLHSGDPAIYGAIREQMNELDKLEISYEVIPGVSSFQAAAAVLKAELTAPEVAQTIILTRSSGRTPLPTEQELKKLAQSRATLCIFLSGHKIGEVAGELTVFYGKDCPAAVIYHASWPDQRVVSGVLGDIATRAEEEDIGLTSLIIVGRALSRDIVPSKLYEASFTHKFRKGDV